MTLVRTSRRRILRAAIAASAGIALPAFVFSQTYPLRPIKLICPWSPGGSTDSVMRVLAASATRHLGQQMFVENKPGASATLGVSELATAKPDGYTLGQLPQTVFRVPHMQKVPYDTLRDFTWIICLTGYTFGMVVPSESATRSMRDVVEYAKANPGKLTYGSTGVGSTPHLVVEEFAMRAGIQAQHVPFKNNADMMQALLGGHIMLVADSTAWAPQVDAGRLRLLATFGTRRTKRWPHVPTLQDLGYETVSDSPFGVCGPRDMDPALVRTVHDVLKKTLDDPVVIATFDRFDQSVIYMDTETYSRWAHETFVAEKATIERLGLASKN